MTDEPEIEEDEPREWDTNELKRRLDRFFIGLLDEANGLKGQSSEGAERLPVSFTEKLSLANACRAYLAVRDQVGGGDTEPSELDGMVGQLRSRSRKR